jgi:DNA-binding SARP family transcriptional activator
MPVLRIKLFGPLQVQIDGKTLDLKHRKGDQLLALLALYHDHPMENDWIAQRLWPEKEDGIDDLRHSIADLRNALKDFGRMIVSRTNTYRFCTEEAEGKDLNVDLIAFEQALEEGIKSAAFETAMRLYDRGAILETWSSKWVREVREKYRERYAEALEARADFVIGQGENEEACRCLRRLARVQPRRERNFVRLMEALIAIGERLEAKLLYERYRDLLQS